MRLNVASLFRFYKRHGITNQATSYKHRQFLTHERQQLREMFAIRLARIFCNRTNLLCYVDETSLNSWMRRKRTYRHRFGSTRVIIPAKRSSGCTVIGALGSFLPNVFVHSTVLTTNKANFISFLAKVRDSSLEPRKKPIYMVLDNHRAHDNEDVREAMRLLNIVPLWMPAYSPEFNSIESLWAVVKGRL